VELIGHRKTGVHMVQNGGATGDGINTGWAADFCHPIPPIVDPAA